MAQLSRFALFREASGSVLLRGPSLVMGICFLAALAESATAATVSVSPGPATIHAALVAAAAGDTLLLQPGTYAMSDPIDVRKNVTFLSSEGPATTILDMQYNPGSVFFIHAIGAGPTIQGLTIMRGAQVFTGLGGGIYSEGSSPRIMNNLFLMNAASNIDGAGGGGAAIAILEGAPLIRNNTFVNNMSGAGAIFLGECSGEVDHNIVAYNRDSELNDQTGFGIACFASTSSIHDNMLWLNLPDHFSPSCGVAPGSANNIVLDPRFCNPVTGPKAMGYDWGVRTDAPSAPGNTYEGWGASLPTCSTTSIAPRSWGSVKSQYR